jgi:hypothetical protein
MPYGIAEETDLALAVPSSTILPESAQSGGGGYAGKTVVRRVGKKGTSSYRTLDQLLTEALKVIPKEEFPPEAELVPEAKQSGRRWLQQLLANTKFQQSAARELQDELTAASRRVTPFQLKVWLNQLEAGQLLLRETELTQSYLAAEGEAARQAEEQLLIAFLLLD